MTHLASQSQSDTYTCTGTQEIFFSSTRERDGLTRVTMRPACHIFSIYFERPNC